MVIYPDVSAETIFYILKALIALQLGLLACLLWLEARDWFSD